MGIEFLQFDGIRANPTVDQIDEAVKKLKGFDARLVIGIGGGSVLDASKVVAVLLKNQGLTARDLYVKGKRPYQALPVVAVNLTHGTGSEIDRYAVATVPELKDKSGLALDCMYPAYSIDDPMLMLSLPAEQTLYTSLDALNHLVEAATTTLSSSFTIMLAREGIKLIAEWLPIARQEPDNLEARYWLLYASVLGGMAIDCGVVHLTHPLEHTLSALKPELPHGLGLTILLPSVVEAIYEAEREVLQDILRPVTGDCASARQMALRLQSWIFSLGVREKLKDVGFSEEDVEELTDYVMASQRGGGSIYLAPLEPERRVVERIFRESLEPLT
ncbi:MAG: iron-containing alcohol dehydrogenase [Nitrospirae bacterium]|nr:MAG: iron-containing alcohol dehydrogenase [Nitrospirota bacterium]